MELQAPSDGLLFSPKDFSYDNKSIFEREVEVNNAIKSLCRLTGEIIILFGLIDALFQNYRMTESFNWSLSIFRRENLQRIF